MSESSRGAYPRPVRTEKAEEGVGDFIDEDSRRGGVRLPFVSGLTACGKDGPDSPSSFHLKYLSEEVYDDPPGRGPSR